MSIGEEGTDCEIAGSLFSRSSLDFYEKDASGSECLLSMEDEKSTFLGSEFGNEERESTKSPCSAFDQIGRELGAPLDRHRFPSSLTASQFFKPLDYSIS